MPIFQRMLSIYVFSLSKDPDLVLSQLISYLVQYKSHSSVKIQLDIVFKVLDCSCFEATSKIRMYALKEKHTECAMLCVLSCTTLSEQTQGMNVKALY